VYRERLRNLVWRPAPLLIVDRRVWRRILSELRIRGQLERESGAFLLGTRARNIVDAVYFDDLDPNCLTGGISFAGSAYGRLWDTCSARDLEVIGDVHTHPGDWVAQSGTDRAHPMIAREGHVALIVPAFADRIVPASEVGVHEYLGSGRWRSAFGLEAGRMLRIDRWRPWR
jgi:proteasome lid subunit RPN8/RPN11